MEHVPWWQSCVVYQIYPRSFADTTGDGVGDLQGIRSRLPYLQWLGVDVLWLSPVFRSPMADFGYDVSDYCDIDPLFGTLADMDDLIAECHERGMRLMLDWVPNHTSVEHRWFQESRTDRTNPKADWYVWRDQPANNWLCSFSGGAPAWTFDEARSQCRKVYAIRMKCQSRRVRLFTVLSPSGDRLRDSESVLPAESVSCRENCSRA